MISEKRDTVQFDIRSTDKDLTDREYEILNYIHGHIQEVSVMSIQTLSNKVGYSTSTILRLCRKMGYRGFPELKYQLKDLQVQLPSYSETSPNQHITFNQIKDRIMTNVEGSAAFINNDSLLSIARLLNSDKPVYLYMPGGITNTCVTYLERLLLLAGRGNVYQLGSSRMTMHMIQTLEEGCIFFFISHSGNFEITVNLAREAKIHGMVTCSISSIENSDLADLTTYSLRYFTKDRENLGADYSSRICTFFVIASLVEVYDRLKEGDYAR